MANIEPICDLVIGNIPGVNPNILEGVWKTAEEDIQQEEVVKTAKEEMKHVKVIGGDAGGGSEASYYDVTQSESEGDGFNVELNTCADIAESAQVDHAVND